MTHTLAPAWQFRFDHLCGYLAGGREHGLHLAEGTDGNPATRTMCLNLEHYYARAQRGGRFVPRNKAELCAKQIGEDAVEVRVAPYEHWNVTTTIAYRCLPGRVFEARFEFVFGAPYQDFEAFISNYFHSPAEPYVHLGGTWTRPQLGKREHRYWVRGAHDAEVLRDGRLDEFLAEEKEPYQVPVDPLHYDHPIMITPIGETGWSVINAVERELCPSLSANRTWSAHDFSLIGHDVHAGQRITGRAWLIYTKLDMWDDAIRLYESLVGTL
jgi:hypothetical protein